jgi:hypothetical protein
LIQSNENKKIKGIDKRELKESGQKTETKERQNRTLPKKGIDRMELNAPIKCWKLLFEIKHA